MNFFYIKVISDYESIQKNTVPYGDKELDFLNKA